MINTSRITKPAVNQVKLRQVPITVSYTRNFDLYIMPFQDMPFYCQCLRDLYNKHRKKQEDYLPFLTAYQTRLSQDVKNISFEQDKKSGL